MNNDTLTLFLATSILAIGGVGLYMFQSTNTRQVGGKKKRISEQYSSNKDKQDDNESEYKDDEPNDYNEYNEDDDESYGNDASPHEYMGSFNEFDKTYDKKQKTPKTKKVVKSQNKGTKRKY